MTIPRHRLNFNIIEVNLFNGQADPLQNFTAGCLAPQLGGYGKISGKSLRDEMGTDECTPIKSLERKVRVLLHTCDILRMASANFPRRNGFVAYIGCRRFFPGLVVTPLSQTI